MSLSPYFGETYVVIETSGVTFAVSADPVVVNGVTNYTQIYKMAYGPTGSLTVVDTATPLPVTVSGGMTATISGFCGTINIQGIGSGTPVPVSGTVSVMGITASPVYVQTTTGCRVEVTGGRFLNKLTDNVSVFGPSGNTWIYSNLVNASGVAIGTTANPMQVSFSGVTITANIASTIGVTNDSAGNGLRIQGTLNAQLLSIAGSVPSTIKSARTAPTNVVSQMDMTGFTCSHGINLKAAATNTNLVYFAGNTAVSATTSYGLDPGEEIFVKVNNTNKIFTVTGSGTQALFYNAS